MTYTIRQTDCRTGWQVIQPNGKVYITVRRPEAAKEIANEINGRMGQ